MTVPLPRSLDPLPQESLPGYLLRLAHRLDSWPGRIAELTGLTAPRANNNLPGSRMFALDPAMSQTFAAATRLSATEVTSLTLASLGSRYPPLDSAFSGRNRRISGIFVKENWVFSRATRHCPDCLAGDGSLIQQRHGGAWSMLWRLPVVFACPVHHRLLEHTCPACDKPAHSHDADHAQLVQLAGHPDLHPAQCRTPTLDPDVSGGVRACGHRLDISTSTSSCQDNCAHEELLHFQQRLLDYLQPDSPQAMVSVGQETTSARYFVDLRILACLITASWPTTRDLLTDPTQALLLDTYVRNTRRQIQAVRRSGRVVREISFYDRPPLQAATCASLLALADHITTAGDHDTVRDLLHPLLDAAPITRGWTRQFLVGDGYCSPGLQTALGLEIGTLHVIQRTGIRTRVLVPPPRPVRFGIQHIPQHLLPDWHAEHLDRFTTKVKPHLLRRAAAARLAQICVGGSATNAAQLLGIPREATSNALAVVQQQLHQRSRRAFDAAIDALADKLNNTVDLTDYGTRRDVLTAWSITPEEWAELIVGLPRQRVSDCHRRRAKIDWAESKRILSSAWVWVRITHGEHIFAPAIRPNLDQPRPGSRFVHDIHTRWSLISAAQPTGHYIPLRVRLEAYADKLTTDIDHNLFRPKQIASSAGPQRRLHRR